MPHDAARPVALTIAGSDSGGGAGIQADLKTFHARGVHGTSVITSITSQNSVHVTAVHAVPLAHVRSQLAAVFEDFPVAAVKTGMLGSAAAVRLVAYELRRRRPPWLVVDPVMIASSGSRLLDEDAVAMIRDELLPLADLFTPNIPEAETLLGLSIRTAKQFDRAAEALLELGAGAVLLKGGHGRGDDIVDRFYDVHGQLELRHPRLPHEGRGTGCTLAAAIAAELARNRAPRAAVRRAVQYVQMALRRSYRSGGGASYLLAH